MNAAYLQPGRFSALWMDGVVAQGIQDFPQAVNFSERFATQIDAMILKMAKFQLHRPYSAVPGRTGTTGDHVGISRVAV
ncbi:MAG TPA: hypothetical protein VLA49_01250 [Anaerolineales bacterium]|nr:hypothetical protein [Anaerolineales bacterium]